MLWYFGSNNKKNEIAELHIINALMQTYRIESEQCLDISHLNVNAKITRRIN